MELTNAVLAIYALRGYEKTTDDINVALEIQCLIEDAESDGYAFTSETTDDFLASGWTMKENINGATKLTKGKADIYIVGLDDASLGMLGTKNLTFLDA